MLRRPILSTLISLAAGVTALWYFWGVNPPFSAPLYIFIAFQTWSSLSTSAREVLGGLGIIAVIGPFAFAPVLWEKVKACYHRRCKRQPAQAK